MNDPVSAHMQRMMDSIAAERDALKADNERLRRVLLGISTIETNAADYRAWASAALKETK